MKKILFKIKKVEEHNFIGLTPLLKYKGFEIKHHELSSCNFNSKNKNNITRIVKRLILIFIQLVTGCFSFCVSSCSALQGRDGQVIESCLVQQRVSESSPGTTWYSRFIWNSRKPGIKSSFEVFNCALHASQFKRDTIKEFCSSYRERSFSCLPDRRWRSCRVEVDNGKSSSPRVEEEIHIISLHKSLGNLP